jgi:hypothetical protein
MTRKDEQAQHRFTCDTCGRETPHLRRDVLDAQYNALGSTPLWNCYECYGRKRSDRLERSQEKS